jgi:hypothetical protein
MRASVPRARIDQKRSVFATVLMAGIVLASPVNGDVKEQKVA